MQHLKTTAKNFPAFNHINFSDYTQELTKLLQINREQIANILSSNPSEWHDLLPKLMLIDNKLNCFWSPLQHLHSVANNKQLRTLYSECLPLLTEYATELGQNTKLQEAYSQIHDSATFQTLDCAQKQVINNALRDFHLAGVDLPTAKKQRFRKICQQLAALTTQFENNLLDATQNWQKHITDETLIAGIPETALQRAAELAQREHKSGWILTLDFPCYHAVISYADNAALRQEIYRAYVTRASELGEKPEWDNSQLMYDIIKLRDEQAKLLGFTNYAEYSLATKMVDNPQQAIDFLENLLSHCKVYAKADYAALVKFAHQQYQIDTLEPWDIAYYSEKLCKHEYSISQETLRPYFPIEKVLKGLFEILQRLFGITAKLVEEAETWHPDVSCYEIHDQQGALRGICYLDLYAREGKRSGAWMDDYCARFRLQDGTIQTPIAFITCNFMPPNSSHPALLTHDDVVTLFHEFGHGLHHMLTTIDYLDVSGIAGVPWDAVELPSQFMENWCWQKEALTLISQHYQTGEPLPETDFQRLFDAKNFQAGLAMVRQIEFALFDMHLHTEFNADNSNNIQATLDAVRQQTSVYTVPKFNRFQHSFAHIFAGGYAAGYYSYLWAEVLSSDAFAKFEETGIFNPDTGHDFLTKILQQGGSKAPQELFIAFRGREPKIDALLRHSGFDINLQEHDA